MRLTAARFLSTATTRHINPHITLHESLSSLLRNKSHKVHEARRLHAHLLVTGNLLKSNTPRFSQPGSHLVQIYARSGSLKEALLLFQTLRHVDNVTCNAILRAHVVCGMFSGAIMFFNHLISERSFVPDNHTCPIILKACSGLCDLEEGRSVHQLICSLAKARSFKPNVYTKCALIDMFAKCGSLDEARVVFDELPISERDLASWTAMICGTIQQGRGDEALEIFKMMRLQGTSPDSVLVAAILPACGRSEAKRMGTSLQGFSIKSGFDCDLFVSNALLDMYCKFGDTDEAYSIFSRMVCKDVVTWSTLICGYSQNGQYKRSIDMYKEMVNVGAKSTAIAVASILPSIGRLNLPQEGKVMHCYVLKRGFDFDIVVANAMMEMYSSCGLTDDMEVLFNTWSDWDVMIWNSAITGHANAGNFDQALRIFSNLKESSFKPNEITLLGILPICTKMGALKQGMEVHGYILKSSLTMAISASNSIIDMYCKCGQLELGLKVFNQISEKETITYNTMISAYGFRGYGNKALLLFDEMKAQGIKPTKVTFIGLLSACSHAGLVDKGINIYNSMINSYGIQPNMEHYSCMVDLLGRAGRVEEACEFIRMMPEEPDGNVLGCLLAACQFSNNMEHAHLVEEILQDKLEDSGYHILLSNMYASTNKWKDSSRVRALIKEKGLRKKPGHSWIEIDRCTHVFDARDTTHPEFSDIEVSLERLFLEMKMEWHEKMELVNFLS